MRLAIVVALLLAPAAARAYPQFQLTTGAVRCNQCHYAPAGGGLINGYGREEAADTISAGGDGAFLHGAWQPPSWLALGGDLRVAGLVLDEGDSEGAELAAFPMQVDLYARAAVASFSVYVNVGFRGSARPDEPTLLSRILSREHYLMWRPSPTGPYARVGRFFAPYGLRVAEHTAYIRRFLGFNTLEETYGLSGGWVDDDWELHVTAFVPDPIRPVGQAGRGAAAYLELRLGARAAVGAQARVSDGDEDTRAQGGLVAKLVLPAPEIQLLAEVDLVHQRFAGLDAARWQLAGYLGAAWLVHRGWMVQAMVERYDEDLAVTGVARDAVSAAIQWFPIAHVEAALYGRAQIIADGAPSELLLVQLHYYL